MYEKEEEKDKDNEKKGKQANKNKKKNTMRSGGKYFIGKRIKNTP